MANSVALADQRRRKEAMTNLVNNEIASGDDDKVTVAIRSAVFLSKYYMCSVIFDIVKFREVGTC